MKKRFLLVILALLTIVSLSACGKSKEENLEAQVAELESELGTLRQENSSLKEENSSLTSEVNSLTGQINASDTELITTIFWRDGKTYYVENCQFYSDCYCSSSIDSQALRFYSPTALKIELSNSNNVYFTLSSQGIVWSVNKPSFREVPVEE